jgi:hypothetical protein
MRRFTRARNQDRQRLPVAALRRARRAPGRVRLARAVRRNGGPTPSHLRLLHRQAVLADRPQGRRSWLLLEGFFDSTEVGCGVMLAWANCTNWPSSGSRSIRRLDLEWPSCARLSQGLGCELEKSHPGAARSLREGLEEILTARPPLSTARMVRTIGSGRATRKTRHVDRREQLHGSVQRRVRGASSQIAT